MNIKRWIQAEYLPILLIALMVLTRFHHFGDFLHLPDASLAVFFFAGFYRKKAFLGFLLGLAALIDYVSIENGTSGWCVTPAYAFLIPTYATMWIAGRYSAMFKTLHLVELVKAFGLLMLSASFAFVISNASFYLFSGKFGSLAVFDYLTSVSQYYVPFVGSTLVYGILGFGAVKLLKTITALISQHKAI